MAEASYPNFAGKHAGEAMYTAADFIAYMREAAVTALLAGNSATPAGDSTRGPGNTRVDTR